MKTAVILPSYKVKSKILNVISRIGDEVDFIYVVDDCCPERSGQYIKEHCSDPRVTVLFHNKNTGVGGAMITGYLHALKNLADVLVKIDGDGQMPPEILPQFIGPILEGRADYTKGNRFYNIEDCRRMPLVRVLGNAALSFFTKFSSGYWDIFDPTNGYTAISANVLKKIPLHKVSQRYFFESDLLFRLSLVDALVKDIPMEAVYEDEVSNLKIRKILLSFLNGHIRNTSKRIFYTYFLRGFSIASVELVLGIFLLSFGVCFGLYKWILLALSKEVASSGTVMLAALPIILGSQLLLSFLNHDIQLSLYRQKNR